MTAVRRSLYGNLHPSLRRLLCPSLRGVVLEVGGLQVPQAGQHVLEFGRRSILRRIRLPAIKYITALRQPACGCPPSLERCAVSLSPRFCIHRSDLFHHDQTRKSILVQFSGSISLCPATAAPGTIKSRLSQQASRRFLNAMISGRGSQPEPPGKRLKQGTVEILSALPAREPPYRSTPGFGEPAA